MAMLAKSMANAMWTTMIMLMPIVLLMMVLMVMMMIAGDTVGVMKIEAPSPLDLLTCAWSSDLSYYAVQRVV